MVGVSGASEFLPDEQTWELTKHELMTIHRALEWREGKAVYLRHSQLLRDEWSHITNEIKRVLREVWHSEGKYWM
jgi:Iap family predicted aminopeptidase